MIQGDWWIFPDGKAAPMGGSEHAVLARRAMMNLRPSDYMATWNIMKPLDIAERELAWKRGAEVEAVEFLMRPTPDPRWFAMKKWGWIRVHSNPRKGEALFQTLLFDAESLNVIRESTFWGQQPDYADTDWVVIEELASKKLSGMTAGKLRKGNGAEVLGGAPPVQPSYREVQQLYGARENPPRWHRFDPRRELELDNVAPNPGMANGKIQQLAKRYVDVFGYPPMQETPYVQVISAMSRLIAEAYMAMPDAPDDPTVRRAYAALVRECHAQYARVREYVEIIPFSADDPNPYRDSSEMFTDIADNHRLMVFSGGDDHSVLSREENFMFRGVHDFFGHAAKGFAFGPRGEENAWIEHSKMFSPLARWALTSETRGQNSWVNFGPFSHLPVGERPYAEQKSNLLPVPLCLRPEFEEAYAPWPRFQTEALEAVRV